MYQFAMFVLSFLVRIETKQRVAAVIVGQNRNKKQVVAFMLRHCISIIDLQRNSTICVLWLYLCDGIVVLTLLVMWCVKTNSCFISVAWLCCHCRSRQKESTVVVFILRYCVVIVVQRKETTQILAALVWYGSITVMQL